METEVARKPYPSDVTDEEWAFVAPYLTLMTEEAPRRRHDLGEVFNSLRWIVRTSAQWRYACPSNPAGTYGIKGKRAGGTDGHTY